MSTQVGKLTYISISWTSDSGGDATVVIPDYKGFEFAELKTWPSGGTTAPDVYTVTLIDNETSGDILVGEGAGRSGTEADDPIVAYAGKPIPGVMTFTVAGAGSANQGFAVLALRAT